MTREDIKTINDIVHKTIYGFFDICGDKEETPMTDKDKLLLEVNKAVCNNIKDLEQEPCEDWYDVSSNEMTLEQARQAVKDLRKKLVECLEQEPCEDAISRQATLEPYKKLKDTDTLCVALIRANIMQQPSINPQKSPQHTKCDQCPYEETKVVNICNYDGDGCGWD